MASYHTRSISLPSANPITEEFDEQLCRLRSSQAASTSSISHSLSGLVDLYLCVDDLLQLPSNQQAVSQIQVALDGSLRLLDICSTSRDILQQSKERLQDIQSVLRRRSSGELNVTKEVVAYLNTRKSVKKATKKTLKNIKDTDKSAEASDNMLKNVEDITLDIFKSLLSYIGGTKSQSRKSNWSLVTKFIQHSSDKEAAAPTSVFDAVDATLDSLISQKSGINMLQSENMRSQMVKLESEIQDLDEILECLFRHLVKTRATLLNILSN